MSAYSIRPATNADVQAIARIHASYTQASLTKGAATATSAPDQARQLAFWKDAVEFGEPLLLVACHQGGVVGFGGYDRSRDARTPPTMGEIWFLHVLPEHHGKGAGLALWDGMREGLVDEGCTQVSVWIPLANDRALRFHELAGFKREMSSARTTAVAGGARVEEIRLKRAL